MDEITGGNLLGVLVTVCGAVLVLLWASFRWSRLKPALFPQRDEPKPVQSNLSTTNGDLRNRRWLKDIPTLLAGVRRELEREKEMEAPVHAIRKMETEARNLATAVESVLIKSLESGELHSLLLGADGVFTYIVGVPNRYEHPHLIRRYAAFSAGWIHHANLVKATLISNGEFSALISYLFFLSPDAKEGGVLLVSYADAYSEFVPSRLIQENEMKFANVRLVNASLEFTMST